jgi:hypothetical protein
MHRCRPTITRAERHSRAIDGLAGGVVVSDGLEEFPRRTRPSPLKARDDRARGDIDHARRLRRSEQIGADAQFDMNPEYHRHRIAPLLSQAEHLTAALLGVVDRCRHAGKHAAVDPTVGELALELRKGRLDPCDLVGGDPHALELAEDDLPAAGAGDRREGCHEVVGVGDLVDLPADRLVEAELACARPRTHPRLGAGVEGHANGFAQPIEVRCEIGERDVSGDIRRRQ